MSCLRLSFSPLRKLRFAHFLRQVPREPKLDRRYASWLSFQCRTLLGLLHGRVGCQQAA